jgi:hypothetical protein
MPNNANARTIKFVTNNLGRDVTLMCAFEPLKDTAFYKDQYPVCWKVIDLNATGQGQASVTYTAFTAFFIPQVDRGNIVTAQNAQMCGTGQRVTLKDNDGDHELSEAAVGVPKYLECLNKVPAAADIGIGFTDKKGENLDPALVWTKVAVGATLKAKFTPVLKIYATADYQETQMIRGEIEYPVIWQGDLQELAPSSIFRVTYDSGTGLPAIDVE